MTLSDNTYRAIEGGGMITAYPTRAFDITPSDETEWSEVGVSVWVGGSGDVTVEPWHGNNTVTFSMVEGQIVPVTVRRVLSTGTTATGLIGIY